MQSYAALKLNLYFVLKILVVIGTCILCLWDIQLTFDSYKMGHFESFHIDEHRIRNLLVLVG